jgi:Ca2+-transporting ATPase
LCVDKTGTLTHNQMTVTELYSHGQTLTLKGLDPKGVEGLPEVFHELVEYGALATDPEPFDPMDKALNRVLATYLGDTEHVHPQWDLVKRYPLAPALLARSNVWRSSAGESQPGANGKSHPVAAKGAPEAIFDLCHLKEGQRPVYEKQVQGMARRGLRVLGVAKARGVHGDHQKRIDSDLTTTRVEGGGDPSLPSHQHDFDFEFVGLIGLEDPLRAEVPAAVSRCHRAGIRVIMITGDHPETAAAIGQQAGLTSPTGIMTGSQMETLAPEELTALLGGLAVPVSICARMSPLQKRRLVEALKARGEIIAMTGDGVNDAPALKIAHVGIAMGQRGTDVAREAASLVLLNDDFGSIVNAIGEGRRIYDNLEKTMSYLMTIHVPIAGLSLLPLLTQKPAVMLPIHVAMLHLLIEPVCSLVFARMAGPANLMERSPRSPTARLFSKAMVGDVLTYGGVTLLVMGLVYLASLQSGFGEAGTRTLVFATLIGANVGMILRQMGKGSLKSIPPRETVKRAVSWIWVAVGSLVLLGIAVLSPLSKWFLFEKVPLSLLGIALLLGFVANLVLWIIGDSLFAAKQNK